MTVVCICWLKLSTSQFMSWKFPSVGVVLNTNIWGQDGISLSLGMVECEDVFRIGPIDELPWSKRWNLGLQTNWQFRGKYILCGSLYGWYPHTVLYCQSQYGRAARSSKLCTLHATCFLRDGTFTERWCKYPDRGVQGCHFMSFSGWNYWTYLTTPVANHPFCGRHLRLF